MKRGEVTIVSGVHGYEEGFGFSSPYLSNYYSVWTHPEGVLHQSVHINLSFAFDIGCSGFESHQMLYRDLKLCRVLDGDDPLFLPYEDCEGVHCRCLSTPCSACYNEVFLPCSIAIYHNPEKGGYLCCERLEINEVHYCEGVFFKLAYSHS